MGDVGVCVCVFSSGGDGMMVVGSDTTTVWCCDVRT